MLVVCVGLVTEARAGTVDDQCASLGFGQTSGWFYVNELTCKDKVICPAPIQWYVNGGEGTSVCAVRPARLFDGGRAGRQMVAGDRRG